MNRVEAIATKVVDAAFKVHTSLGPGLLESAYEVCLSHELRRRKFQVEQQKMLPISYQGVQIDAGYRLDLLVEDSLIVELKTVEKILPIPQAQLLTYLKLSRKTLGLIINLNVELIKNGIRRVVLNHPETMP